MISTEHKKKIRTTLKKINGMTKKIHEMVDNDVRCIKTVQQVNAMIGLLKNMNLTILESHLRTCARHELTSEDDVEQAKYAKELVQTFSMISKK